VFGFSTQLLSNNVFHPKKHSARYHKCTYVGLHVKHLLFLPDLIKLEFSQHIFEKKILKYQISQKSVQWEPSCSVRTEKQTDRRTNRHDEANSRFSYKTALILIYNFLKFNLHMTPMFHVGLIALKDL